MHVRKMEARDDPQGISQLLPQRCSTGEQSRQGRRLLFSASPCTSCLRPVPGRGGGDSLCKSEREGNTERTTGERSSPGSAPEGLEVRPQTHAPTRAHSSHAKTVRRGKQRPQRVMDKRAACTDTGGDSAGKRSGALTHTQPRTLETRRSVRAAKNTRPHSERFRLCETARTGKSTDTERSVAARGWEKGNRA